MPFFGFNSHSKKSADRDQQQHIAPAHPHELYAQIDSLQSEMSHLYMQIAFMKTDNGDSLRRPEKKEQVSPQPLVTRETKQDTTKPPSAPWSSSIDDKPVSSNRPLVVDRRIRRKPPPLPEIFIPAAALREGRSRRGRPTRREDDVGDDGELLMYRIRPSSSRDQSRESALLRHEAELQQQAPTKRTSGKSNGSKTVSTADPSRSSKSGGSSLPSNGVVRYRTVKRIVEQREILEPKLEDAAKVPRTRRPVPTPRVPGRGDRYAEHANEDDDGYIGKSAPLMGKTNILFIDYPPPPKVKETNPLPVSRTRMAKASEKASSNIRLQSSSDAIPLPREIRRREMGLLKPTTPRKVMAQTRRLWTEGMDAVIAELRKGVTLKPAYLRVYPRTSKKSASP